MNEPIPGYERYPDSRPPYYDYFSMCREIPLSHVHTLFSGLLVAAKHAIPQALGLRVIYDNHTYLQLKVMTRSSQVEIISAILMHGLLHEDYDFRFSGTSYPSYAEPPEKRNIYDSAEVYGILDLQYKRLPTPIPLPSFQTLRNQRNQSHA